MSKRRRYLPVSLVALVAMLGAAPAMAAVSGSRPDRQTTRGPSAPAATAKYAPGRALVKFRPGMSMAGMRGIAASAGAAVLRDITSRGASGGKLLVVKSKTATTAELVRAFSADPRVQFAEPDYLLHVDATPNDTRFAELWGMQQISAPGAWDITTGSSGVVIADIDTGVDYTHPDLAANMWHNPGETPGNGIDDDGNGYSDDVYGIDAANNDSDPMDDDGHGTHTSGTAAAVGNNGVGVAGVAWQARIMALKFLDASGSGSTSDAIACINYAIAEDMAGVDVAAINASWGGGDYSVALRNAINAAGARDIVFVASAGNGGQDEIGDDNDAVPQYPSSYDCANIVAVAATDDSDALASFSNYGVQSVDIAAPGVGILSTVPASVFPFVSYAGWSGTSMAAPHVTGATALCAARYPAETISQRIARVLDSVDAVAGLSGKVASGGRLNVGTAVSRTDDDIPGLPAMASPIDGMLSSPTDTDDVYSVHLDHGDVLQASISGPDGSDFWLYLYAPDAVSIWTGGPGPVGSATGGEYPKTLRYAAGAGGTYYLDAFAASGGGTYRITYTVTAPTADDDIPGVPLGISPLAGTVEPAGDCDVFSFHAAAGESIQLSLTAADDTDFGLFLYAPGAATVAGPGGVGSGSVASSAGATYPKAITYTADTAGVYYVVVYGSDGTGPYQLTHNIDFSPPVTTVVGADNSWHRSPVTLAFSASDNAGGSGWAYTEYDVDGTGFVRGTAVTVSANGSHTVAYRSADNRGNIEAARTTTVNVDSGRPATLALANVAVRKGRRVTMRFRVNDVTPRATVTIKIYRGRRAVKTLRVGQRATNSTQKLSWTCKLAKARYTWKVYATDLARNQQGETGRKTLSVR